MTIKVVCQCGASFGAKDELAGRSVACPKCKQPLQIGAAPAAAPAVSNAMNDLLDEAGFDNVQGPRCPKCSKPIQPGSLMCVSCGFNLQTGEVIEGADIQLVGARGEKGAANKLLDNATNRIAQEKLEDKKTRAQGAPIWVIFVGLAGVLAFVACMLAMPRDLAFRYNGIGLIAFGNIIAIVYSIRICIVAFKENVVCGLLYLFLPFYALFFIITRWSQISGLFMMLLLGNLIVGLGCGMIAMSPYMAIKEDDGFLSFHQHVPAAVANVDFEIDSLPPVFKQEHARSKGIAL